MLIVTILYFMLLILKQININDPYTKMCVPDVVKNLNVKVFNLMSRTKETKHIEWHETC